MSLAKRILSFTVSLFLLFTISPGRALANGSDGDSNGNGTYTSHQTVWAFWGLPFTAKNISNSRIAENPDALNNVLLNSESSKRVTIKKLKLTGYHTASLTWNAVTNAMGYEIERSTSSKTGFVKTGETTAPTVIFSEELQRGEITYYYRVRSYIIVDGNRVYGSYSSVRSIKPKWPVQKTSAAATGINSFRISWTGVSGAVGYDLYCSTSSKSGFALLQSGITDTKFNAQEFKSGTTYYFKVKPYDAAGCYGPYSKTASAKTVWPSVKAPKVSVKDFQSLTVSWNAVADAQGYEVYRGTSAKGTYSPIGQIASENSFIDKGLKTGKTYYYKIRPYTMVKGQKDWGPYSSYDYCMPRGIIDRGLDYQYFLSEGEEVVISADKTQWSYRSKTLSVQIQKIPGRKKMPDLLCRTHQDKRRRGAQTRVSEPQRSQFGQEISR